VTVPSVNFLTEQPVNHNNNIYSEIKVSEESLLFKNTTNLSVDVTGWRLRNLKTKKVKRFPPGLQIPPDGIIRVWTGIKTQEKDNGITDFYWKKNAWDINNYDLVLRDSRGQKQAQASKTISTIRSTSSVPSSHYSQTSDSDENSYNSDNTGMDKKADCQVM